MKKIIIGLLVFLVIGGLGAFFILERIGDYMLDSMIEAELNQALVPLESSPINPPEPTTNQTPETSRPAVDNTQTSTPVASKEEAKTPDTTPNASKEPAKTSDTSLDKQENTTQNPESTPTATPKPTPTPISTEQIKEIKDSVTSVDKASAAALVLSKLTKDDIAILQSFLSDGVTAEEKKKAKEIAYARFTPEELETVKDLYRKYMDGLKQN